MSSSTPAVVPGNYIVVFKDSATEAQIDEYAKGINATGGQVNHRYNSALKGFSARMDDTHLKAFKGIADDIVDYIEPDQVVTIQPSKPTTS
ncbi:hypothetical protein FRB94_013090 [Tulasnella sp. JGI-2019a]|nr:hypothetical protein FRB94_013090 [Tulasnella sp. JGI-2019a]KAG8997652.1 hypothetical protein FRB93_014012 [Tulasnella sp. JGI-2019a]KAG9023593.1 hypothetical protein FRB95_012737 [Tulasnella sp. JGI-2019a]